MGPHGTINCGTQETATKGTIAGMVGMLVMMVVLFVSVYVEEEAYWILPIAIVPPSLLGILYAYKVARVPRPASLLPFTLHPQFIQNHKFPAQGPKS